MDVQLSSHNQQLKLGSWHPAMRPNTCEHEDGNEGLTVASFPHSASLEDQAGQSTASYQLPFRPKSSSEGQLETHPSLADHTSHNQPLEDLGIAAGDDGSSLQDDTIRFTIQERQHIGIGDPASEEMSNAAEAQKIQPDSSDSIHVIEHQADGSIGEMPLTLGSTLEDRAPAPGASSHLEGAFGHPAEMDRVWELEEKEKPTSKVAHTSRTNSFPVVPPMRHTIPAPPLSLPHSHVESILECDENADSAMALDNDPPKDPFASISDRDDEGFFANPSSGEGFVAPAEADEESRYEEGLPLMTTSNGENRDPLPSRLSSYGAKGPNAVEEQFESSEMMSPGPTKDTSAFVPHPLDRKSTAQVLSSMQHAPNAATHSELEVSDDTSSLYFVSRAESAVSPQQINGQIMAEQEMRDLDPKPKDEDLAEMWKAALGDDDFLEENEDTVDPSAFFGDDGEGFLEDDQIQAGTRTSASPTLEPLHEPGTRIQGVGDTRSTQSGSQDRYLPGTVSQPAPNPQLAQLANISHQPSSAPMGLAGTERQPSYARQAVPRPQMPTSTQSFADKSKGGYTSPYDLPMDVARPKKRTTNQQVHPSFEVQSPPNRPPPPRSSSMFTGAPPPTESQPPMPRLPSAYSPAKTGIAVPPTLKSSPSMSSFFEELPSTNSRPPSTVGKFTSPTTQPNPAPSMPSQLGSSRQYSPTQSSSLDVVKSRQQYELLPPERMSLYGNTGQAEPANKVIPAMKARYSPAPTQPPIVPPPQNRYAASPAAGSRPPISQTLPFQPRTSSPLAQNHSLSQGRQQVFVSDRSARRPQSSGKQYAPLRDSGNPSLPFPRTSDSGEIDVSGYRSEANGDVMNVSELSSSPPSTSTPNAGLSTSGFDPSYAMKNLEPGHLPSDDSSSFPRSRETPAFDLGVSSRGQPRRSQTQSPGAGQYTNAQVPYQRPASTNFQMSNTPNEANLPHGNHVTRRGRASSNGLTYIQPTDGRELDQLERWKGCPIFSFGFGGTIVTSFPKQIPRYAAGQAVPMMKCSPGEVKLQDGKILPFEEDIAAFPGPLKSKSKKKDVMDWLHRRISRLEDDLGAIASSSSLPDPSICHEEKILLWKIVRVLVEHDGVLDNNASAEKAVRSILSPELTQGDTVTIPIQASNASLLGIVRRSRAPTVSNSTNPVAMEDLRKALLHGEREKAVWHAVDNGLWAHALLLSSTLDPNIWKQVSQEFVRQEVKTYGENTEALAALYQIFAGNCEESADELVPPSARAGLQMVSKTATSGPTKNALDGLDRWRETLTLILSNRTPNDGKALVSLGQLLAGYGRTEAAHICYIFAKSPGIFGGPDDSHVSVALLGADHLQHAFDYGRDIDSILLTEVYEFAHTVIASSSVTTVSPHLQSFKLYHTMLLAEYGYKFEAQQYCENITSTLNSTTKRSPYYHLVLLEALNGLTERLRQAPRDNSGSWISKPSIDKVSGSIWAKFNQYVAGDESDAASVGSGKGNDSSAGPFAVVAGESPTLSRTPSSNDLNNSYGPGMGVIPSIPFANASNSRYAPAGLYTPRSSLEHQGRPSQDPPRSGLHESLRPAPHQQQYQSRPNSSTSSYNEPYRSGPIVSAHPSRTESYLPTPPLQPQHMPQAPPDQPSMSLYQHETERSTFPPESQASRGLYQSQDDPLSPHGYGTPSSFDNTEPPAYEPPTLNHYEPPASGTYEPPPQDPYGSLVEESQPERKLEKKSYMDGDDDDEFEARAAAIRREEKARKDREADEAFRRAAEADAQKDKAPKLSSKKSRWFGGWLGGKKPESEEARGTPNAPIKAKLGEQSSFYYDSEQKRWINRKDPDAAPTAKSTPPPPRGAPSRAVSASGLPPMSTSATPPIPPPPASTSMIPVASNKPPISDSSPSNPPSHIPSPGSSPVANASLKPAAQAEASGTPSGPPSAPPSRPATSMSDASSIDDLIGAPQARRGGTIRKGKKKGYVDVMAK